MMRKKAEFFNSILFDIKLLTSSMEASYFPIDNLVKYYILSLHLYGISLTARTSARSKIIIFNFLLRNQKGNNNTHYFPF